MSRGRDSELSKTCLFAPVTMMTGLLGDIEEEKWPRRYRTIHGKYFFLKGEMIESRDFRILFISLKAFVDSPPGLQVSLLPAFWSQIGTAPNRGCPDLTDSKMHYLCQDEKGYEA